MKLLQRKSKKKGFTLVELMVVIAIIAVLLLVAVPKLADSTQGAKVRTFEANFRTFMSAANAVYADAGLDKSKITGASGDGSVLGDLIKRIDGKPAGAVFTVENNGVIKGVLTGTDSGLDGNYTVEFDVVNSKFQNIVVTGTKTASLATFDND